MTDHDEIQEIYELEEFKKLLEAIEESNPRFRDLPIAKRKLAVALLMSGQAVSKVPNWTRGHFTRKVPTIEEFLTPEYIGDTSQVLFGKWKDDLIKVFSPDSVVLQWALTGAIGCIVGNTKIRLLDSKSYTIRELAEKGRDSEFWVFSWDIERDQMAPGKASNCYKSGTDVDTYEVSLSPQGKIRVTWDHPFLLTNGQYKKAIDLKPGDSIQSLYLYESSSKFFDGALCFDNEQPVHRKVAEYIYGNIEGKDIHHKDFNRLNNIPSNLEPLTPTEHLTYHANEYWARPSSREQRSKEVSERMTDWQSEAMHQKRREWLDNGGREEITKRLIEYNKTHPCRRDEVTLERITETAKLYNTSVIHSIAKKLDCSAQRIKNVLYSSYPRGPIQWIEENSLPMTDMQVTKYYNHTVLSVEYAGKDDVYDLTVDKFHNYGIDDGSGNLIFTHNTGKSTVGLIAQLYNLYRILSLRRPQLSMGSDPSKPMTLQLFTVTKEKAQTTLMDRVKLLLKANSHCKEVRWENEFGYFFGDPETEKITPWCDRGEEIVFPHSIKIVAGSQDRHALGEDVFGGLLDEAEYRIGAGGRIDKAFGLFDNIFERIRSRFLGIPYVLMTLISSISHEKGVMSTKIGQMRGDPTCRVSQYAIWETKFPDALDHDGHIWVMRGTQRHPSRVLGYEECDLADKGDFDTPPGCEVFRVPKRYAKDFELRTESSLMNLAGKASMGQEIPFDDLTRVEDKSLCPVLHLSAPLTLPGKPVTQPIREQLPKNLFIATPEGWRFRRYPGAPRYCLTGDTRIKLLSGISKTIEEMIEDQNRGVQNWCYTWSPGGWVPGRVASVHFTKMSDRITCLTLDNRKVIKSTPEHQFMLRDGSYKSAENLTTKDSLMPPGLNHKIISNVTIRSEVPVYDLTIDNEHHNFLLDAGVVVHNCGWDGAAVSTAGLAVVHKELSQTGRVMYVADLLLKITSVNRVNLEAVKDFIIDLRDVYGLSFHTFTADQYQSEQLLQKLTSIGFAQTVKLLSVIKTRNPYDTLSTVVAQDCLKTGQLRDLWQELEGVYFEKDKVMRQYNMSDNNSHGDLADALCQAVYNAVQNPFDIPTNMYIENEEHKKALSRTWLLDYKQIA